MKDRLLLTVFIVVLLIFATLVARKVWLNNATDEPIIIEPLAVAPASQREILLYFAVPGAPFLEAESRDIAECQTEQECLRRTLLELIAGPQGKLLPVLPQQTLLRGVGVDNDLVVADFSKSFVSGHPGGSMSELLTVYSLVNSLAVNFPYVRQLRILVDGEPLATIKGHVDLRSPVGADFSYTRAVEPTSELALPLRQPAEAPLPSAVSPPEVR